MNFRLNTDASAGSMGDLIVAEQRDGSYGFEVFGGPITSGGIIQNTDELCQVIRTELMLFLSETDNVLGRGMDWFGIFRRSKQEGMRELQRELSRTILSIRTVKSILSLDIVAEIDRHYRIVFRVNTRDGIVSGEVAT